MAWLWTAMRWWAVPILKRYMRTTHLEGREHIPKKGAAILASNHLSALDHLVLPAMTRRTIYNISKKEHFDHKIRAWAFRGWGVIPLDRGKGDTNALDTAKRILRDGHLFCIYPEGTRSRDGHLHKGHTGVARLALELDMPVVPVAMLGTYEKKPPGMKGVNKEGVTGGRAGPALSWPQYAGKHEDRKITRKVTDEIMQAIAALSGQEYVDEYTYNKAYDKNKDGKLDKKEQKAADEDPAIAHER